jgi:hypothetical protein
MKIVFNGWASKYVKIFNKILVNLPADKIRPVFGMNESLGESL